MSRVKVGIIGVGYLGRFHAEKYASHPEVSLIGVADADHDRCTAVAKKLNTRAFDDPKDLFGLVDAVSVVVPTALHYLVAKLFLDHGVHVLIEKPITVTLDQADELIGIASRKGLILQVGHIERFNPAVTAIKGRISSPQYMTAERAAPFTTRCTDVNVVLDLMIHDLDIVTDLAGSKPKALCAAGASVITREIDIATARIVFQDGCVADITASRVSDEKKRILRVFDSEGMYVSDYQTQKATVSHRGSGAGTELIAEDISADRCDTLNEEIHGFIHS
ncbi:MAG TPA: Gfo/Idh/MocA family oxidoreductase, partial [Nitrospirota bacterium]|nr:Gfo/Idh/MocA family oxidoreductase [Nitrospirota bacterium]